MSKIIVQNDSVNADFIGTMIKTKRVSLGMTQEQLGRRCGMFGSAIRRYENGRQLAKPETLIKIANALNTSLDELMGHDSPDKEKGLKEWIEKYPDIKVELIFLFNLLIKLKKDERKKLIRMVHVMFSEQITYDIEMDNGKNL